MSNRSCEHISAQPIETVANDITYVDLLHNIDVDVSLLPVALENTRTKMINQLVTKLPRRDSEPLTPEEVAHRNTKDFVKSWHTKAKSLGTSRLQLRGIQKRISFLSEDAAVGLLQDIGVVPVGADDVAAGVIKNSIPPDDMQIEYDMTDGRWLYDIYPATHTGNQGYILRKFQRGLV